MRHSFTSRYGYGVCRFEMAETMKYLDFLVLALYKYFENPLPPYSLRFIINDPWTNATDIFYLQNTLTEKILINSLVKLTIINHLNREE